MRNEELLAGMTRSKDENQWDNLEMKARKRDGSDRLFSYQLPTPFLPLVLQIHSNSFLKFASASFLTQHVSSPCHFPQHVFPNTTPPQSYEPYTLPLKYPLAPPPIPHLLLFSTPLQTLTDFFTLVIWSVLKYVIYLSMIVVPK